MHNTDVCRKARLANNGERMSTQKETTKIFLDDPAAAFDIFPEWLHFDSGLNELIPLENYRLTVNQSGLSMSPRLRNEEVNERGWIERFDNKEFELVACEEIEKTMIIFETRGGQRIDSMSSDKLCLWEPVLEAVE